MKYLDAVRLVNENKECKKYGIKKGDIGIIFFEYINNRSFCVEFKIPNTEYKHMVDDNKFVMLSEEKWILVKIKDLELVKSANVPDKEIIKLLPGEGANRPYQVEDGFIICVDGTKLNKIAYDYDS